MCAFNYRFVPGGAPGARDDRGRRDRRDPPLPRRLPAGLGRRPTEARWRLTGRRGLGRAGRPRRARHRPRPLPRRRARRGGGARPRRSSRARGRRRLRVDGRLRSGAVGTIEASRFAPGRKNAFTLGGQRQQGLHRVRPRAAQRAAGPPRRQRPGARRRVPDRPRLRARPPVLAVLVAAGAHHRLGAHLRARAAPLPDAIRDDGDVARTAPRFEDGYRAAEVCDAIVRSAATGRRETLSYRD